MVHHDFVAGGMPARLLTPTVLHATPKPHEVVPDVCCSCGGARWSWLHSVLADLAGAAD